VKHFFAVFYEFHRLWDLCPEREFKEPLAAKVTRNGPWSVPAFRKCFRVGHWWTRVAGSIAKARNSLYLGVLLNASALKAESSSMTRMWPPSLFEKNPDQPQRFTGPVRADSGFIGPKRAPIQDRGFSRHVSVSIFWMKKIVLGEPKSAMTSAHWLLPPFCRKTLADRDLPCRVAPRQRLDCVCSGFYVGRPASITQCPISLDTGSHAWEKPPNATLPPDLNQINSASAFQWINRFKKKGNDYSRLEFQEIPFYFASISLARG